MNWGWKISITFGLFVVFILYMVISMLTTKVDLVSDSYYQKEIEFQKQIQSVRNAKNLKVKDILQYDEAKNQLMLKLPPDIESRFVKGELVFFRPSQKLLDIKVPLNLNPDGIQLFDLKGKRNGFWKAQLSFHYKGNDYFIEKELILP